MDVGLFALIARFLFVVCDLNLRFVGLISAGHLILMFCLLMFVLACGLLCWDLLV